MSNDPRSTPGPVGRRRFLAVAGACALPAVVGAADGRATATEFVLDGTITGWVGRAPESIAGQKNPTLGLEADTEASITWTNADGYAHNLRILDADGSVVHRTDTVAEEGGSETLVFAVEPGLDRYRCGFHPQSMQGSIEYVTGPTPTPTATPTRTVTTTPTETRTETATETATRTRTRTATETTTGTRTETATRTRTRTRTATETETATRTRTATETGTATGTGSGDGSQGQPGPGILGALAALAGGGWLLRRRRE